MLSFTTPVLKTGDNQLKLSRANSIRSSSNASSCSSSSPPNIPFKPGHLRSISSQIRVQNRIIRAVEIQQDPLASPQVKLPNGTSTYHGDQSTIKASQIRPSRETAGAMRKLMEDCGKTISPSLPSSHGKGHTTLRKWPEAPHDSDKGRTRVNQPARTYLDVKLESDKDVPRQGRDEVRQSTAQRSSTFTPLITPQRAIALYSFNPEVYDTRNSEREQDTDSTPEVRFQSQDLLEIWVLDIGGGWSLGRNLTSSNCYPTLGGFQTTQSQDVGSNDLGLIPIGWYQIIQSSDSSHTLSKKSSSTLATPKNRTQRIFHPQAGLSPHNVDPNPMEINTSSPLAAQDFVNAQLYQNIATKEDSLNYSEVRTRAKKVSNSLGKNSSDRTSRYAIFPSNLSPSVAVNKEFATNGVFLDCAPTGIACSMTASDAMLAARQAHDRQKADQVDSQINLTSNSSWKFLAFGGSNRHSVAHSYITGQDECEIDPQSEQDCTERYEIEAGPTWKNPLPFFTIQVHHPRLQIHQSNTKAHMIYTVISTFFLDEDDVAQDGSLNRVTVDRRYSHFERLSIGLDSIYKEVFDLPSLPEKGYTTNYDEDYLCDRRRGLERYLVRLTRHPVLRYCPMLTTFLGCEDVEDFEQEARTWGQSPFRKVISQNGPESSASALFFSKVFHPDYNVDEAEVRDSMEAYNKHTKSMENGRAMVELDKNLTNFRNSIQNVSRNFEKMSSSIQRLCAGLSPPHKPPFSRKKRISVVEDSSSDSIDYPPYNDEQKPFRTLGKEKSVVSSNERDLLKDLRREARGAGLQNSDGALCWKEGCTECLAMTKALQLLGQSLGNVAETYSSCAIETLAPVQDLVKELSFPHTNRKVLSDLHDSTKVACLDLNIKHGSSSIDAFESRKETVLNLVMCEIERHHRERNLDCLDLTKKLLDSQIALHQTAYGQLKEARQALEEPQLSVLGSSGPRPMNSSEAKELTTRQELNQSISGTKPRQRDDDPNPNSSRESIDQAGSCSSVLEWVNRSAKYSKRDSATQPKNHHHRNLSVISSSSSIAGSAFSSIFVKPFSAAVASINDLSDYLS